MEDLFLQLVKFSLMASWMVFAILALRLVLRKAPRWIFCIMWALIAVRLVFPFSIESHLSLIPEDMIDLTNPDISNERLNIDRIDTSVASPSADRSPPLSMTAVTSRIWLLGLIIFVIYIIVSSLMLKRKLATATLMKKGIKQSEAIDSPFILGMIKPIIYVPYKIAETDLEFVLKHELAHIRRKDYLWKPFGFFLLAIYWFNPVIWIAYSFMCRDLERACDEKVIKNMKKCERQAYGEALLNCSIHRRMINACPVAFGEEGVKMRIKNIMNYKKPSFWLAMVAFIACIAVSVTFLTNPVVKAGVPSPLENNVYEYPLYPWDDEWAKYDAREKTQMLQLPEAVLSGLSTQDLVKVVIDYPYLSNVFFYDSYEMGFHAVRNSFNGLDELMKREDAAECLIDFYKKIDFSVSVDFSDAKSSIRASNYNAVEVILAQPEINNAISDEERNELESLIKKNNRYENGKIDCYFEALDSK